MVKFDLHLHQVIRIAAALLFAIGLTFLLTQCATTVPPTGGPKDTIPPVLIGSIPQNNQRNFKEQQVKLEFSETVTLREPKEEIIITPSPGKDIQYQYKKNTVTLTVKNPLAQDQTYSVSFRQSVRDITEGNPTEDLYLAFSTGPHIDSLEIKGSVSFLPASKRVGKYTVAIYSADTFNIFKHTPAYFTRTDKSGRFSIKNLKAGTYHIYTFEDKNKNLRCDSQSEPFGFKAEPVTLTGTMDSIHLTAVKMDVRLPKITSYRNISNYGIIRLNKAPKIYSLKPIDSTKDIITYLPRGKSEITYYPEASQDSIQVRLTVEDSVKQKIDSIFYIKQTKQKPIRETFTLEITEASYTSTTQILTAKLKSSHPIIGQLQDSVQLFRDTVLYKNIYIGNIHQIVPHGELTIQTQLNLQDTLFKKPLKLSFAKASFVNVFQDSSKAVNKNLTFRTKENMATLIVLNGNTESYLIQILNDKGDILSQQPAQPKNTFKNLDPMSVQIRKVKDTDRSETWTPGNYYKKKEPEELEYYTNNQGKRQTPLRANWEVEIDWTKPTVVHKSATNPKRQR